MERPSDGAIEPTAGCFSDGPATRLPDGPVELFLDGREIPKFAKSSEDAASNVRLRRPTRRSDRAATTSGRNRLPQFVQALAEQMLAQGASTEQVAEAARECGFARITAAKLDRWLGQDATARERINLRQVKTADDLRASTGAAGASLDALRAEAALFGRLAKSGPAKASSVLDLQDLAAIHRSLRVQLRNENDILKRRAKRLAARKAYLARRIEQAQMHLDHVRLEVVQRRVEDLRDALETSDSPREKQGGSGFAEIVRSLCRLLKIGD